MAELALRHPRRALDQIERRGIAQSIPEDVDLTGGEIVPAPPRDRAARRRASSPGLTGAERGERGTRIGIGRDLGGHAERELVAGAVSQGGRAAHHLLEERTHGPSRRVVG
jgi:hypothetical protein